MPRALRIPDPNFPPESGRFCAARRNNRAVTDECDECCGPPDAPGACCIAGVCSQKTIAECAASGGLFFGGPCGPQVCPPPPPPCCLLTGRRCYVGTGGNVSYSITVIETEIITSCNPDCSSTKTQTSTASGALPIQDCSGAIQFTTPDIQYPLPCGGSEAAGFTSTTIRIPTDGTYPYIQVPSVYYPSSPNNRHSFPGCSGRLTLSVTRSTTPIACPSGGSSSRVNTYNITVEIGNLFECDGSPNPLLRPSRRVLVPGTDFNGSAGIKAAIASAGSGGCSGCGAGPLVGGGGTW